MLRGLLLHFHQGDLSASPVQEAAWGRGGASKFLALFSGHRSHLPLSLGCRASSSLYWPGPSKLEEDVMVSAIRGVLLQW